MRSTACWSSDGRTTSASPDCRQDWDQCARTPDPCTTLAQAPYRCGHPRAAARRGHARCFHPGRRRRRRPAPARQAALLLTADGVRRWRLQPCGRAARLLPARPHIGYHLPRPWHEGLRRVASPVAGRADAALARPVTATVQRLRVPARGLRGLVTLAMIRLMLHRPAHPNRKRPPAP